MVRYVSVSGVCYDSRNDGDFIFHYVSVSDLQTMLDESRYLVLLAKVYVHVERNDEALTALHKAANVQTRVLKRVQLEQPDALPAQTKFAARSVGVRLGGEWAWD